MKQFFIQALGALGMALCVGSFQCRDGRRMVLWQVVGNAVYILQYLLLGAYSGCAGIAVYTIANAVVCFHHDTRKLWQGWKLVFSAILLAVSVLTWKDWASILPLIGSVGVIWSNWSKDEKTIRLGKLLCVGPCWALYGIYVGSIFGAISESVGMASALVALRRYAGKRDEKGEEE